MPLTVVARALVRALTTRAAAKRQLGAAAPADSSRDQLLDDLLLTASQAAETYCHRVFARELVTETLVGDGTVTMMLSRTPVVSVTQFLQDGSPITDYVVEDAEAGFLSRARAFADTRGWSFFLGESRPPGLEVRPFSVTYIGGYLLRGDDVVSDALTCAAGDQSYGGLSLFPLLVPGDQILASGFSVASNNGWKTVVSRTDTKVVVSGEPLVDESAGDAPKGGKTLQVRTLPPDIEQGVIEAIKTWYLAQGRDREVISKRVGDLSIQYRDATGPGVYGEALPVAALGLLRPYARAA